MNSTFVATRESDLKTSENWEETLTHQLYDLYRNDVECDVIIHDADGGIIPAHAVVLMTSSLKIKNQLLQSPNCREFSLTVEGIPAKIWLTILDFIYLGKTTIQRADVTAVMEAAKSIGMLQFASRCAQVASVRSASNSSISFCDDQPLDLTKSSTGEKLKTFKYQIL